MVVGVEIERKFRVYANPALLPLESATRILSIDQGYLCVDALTKDEVRLRAAGDVTKQVKVGPPPSSTSPGDSYEYTLTVKKGTGMVRREEEIHLDIWQFGCLFRTVTRSIKKTRYEIPYVTMSEDGSREIHLLLEVDVFEGALQGLVIMEVEFHTQEDAESFVLPQWLQDVETREVTNDPSYKNQVLIHLSTVPA